MWMQITVRSITFYQHSKIKYRNIGILSRNWYNSHEHSISHHIVFIAIPSHYLMATNYVYEVK
jgi:hypothetical protein